MTGCRIARGMARGVGDRVGGTSSSTRRTPSEVAARARGVTAVDRPSALIRGFHDPTPPS